MRSISFFGLDDRIIVTARPTFVKSILQKKRRSADFFKNTADIRKKRAKNRAKEDKSS
jgi:hypothetical protein